MEGTDADDCVAQPTHDDDRSHPPEPVTDPEHQSSTQDEAPSLTECAASRVFAIPELLEQVLLDLYHFDGSLTVEMTEPTKQAAMKEVLHNFAHLRRVNTACKQTIDGSYKLQTLILSLSMVSAQVRYGYENDMPLSILLNELMTCGFLRGAFGSACLSWVPGTADMELWQPAEKDIAEVEQLRSDPPVWARGKLQCLGYYKRTPVSLIMRCEVGRSNRPIVTQLTCHMNPDPTLGDLLDLYGRAIEQSMAVRETARTEDVRASSAE